MDKTTVFIVDDEPEVVNLITRLAKSSGLSAHGYTRATVLFEEVHAFPPGAVMILDLSMPEMDGIEVMRRLATMQQPPSLILMSGHDIGVLHSAEKLCKAHSLEIRASLTKPLSMDKLRRLLIQHAAPFNSPADKALGAQGRLFDAAELRRGIEHKQLVLHYQPQISLKDGKVCGVEALVRWQHPDQGLIFPDQFIPLAEESGCIEELTNWVINEAVQQEQLWLNSGFFLPISVNVSGRDITSLTLPEQLASLLEDNKLDPTTLTIEITESAVMGELVRSLDILTRLRLKGVDLSIDDFGTGYSSLSQLHKIPFSELKVDRSFVSNLKEDADAQAIVKTCIVLGHELSMRVVAEGVETRGQDAMLKEMGCDIGQGYWYSRPKPAAEFEQWLNERSTE